MNKYIQDYLNAKEEQEKKSLERKVRRVIQDLKMGEIVYGEKSTTSSEFPRFDAEKHLSFRYDIGDATTEEYKKFLAVADPPKVEVKTKIAHPLSKWHTFATVLMVIESVALAIVLLVTILSDDLGWGLFFIVLGAYLFELAFLSIIQLLAGIKQGIDNLQNQ